MGVSLTEKVGGLQSSAIAAGLPSNSNLVMKSMISGLQLKNSVGSNNYVKITPSFSNSTNSTIDYSV